MKIFIYSFIFILFLLSFSGCFLLPSSPPSPILTVSPTPTISFPNIHFSEISYIHSQEKNAFIFKLSFYGNHFGSYESYWWINDVYLGSSTSKEISEKEMIFTKEVNIYVLKYLINTKACSINIKLKVSNNIFEIYRNFSLEMPSELLYPTPSPTPLSTSTPLPISTFSPDSSPISTFTPSPIPTPFPSPTLTPTPTVTPIIPLACSIIIENGKEKTNNTMPLISISAKNANFMSFSGNKKDWTDWLPYAPSYKEFDLNNSPGCNPGDGLKNIYVKFKHKNGGESSIISDDIILDTTPPDPLSIDGPISSTRENVQLLKGKKDKNSSLWINDKEIVTVNPDTAWSYSVNLLIGENTFDIYSKDDVGNESSHITLIIVYDPIIYVDTNTGDDTEGNGTNSHPFKTIVKALQIAEEGDIIYLENGIYNENITINKSIILHGQSKEDVILRPSDISPCIKITTAFVKVESLTIEGANNANYGVKLETEGSKIDNIYLTDIKVAKFKSSASCGIFLGSSTSAVVFNAIIINNTKGIRVGGLPGAKLLVYDTDIESNSYGIYIEDSGIVDAGKSTDISPGRNNIVSNISYGISNTSTNIIYAENNWWGDPDGPKYPYNPNNKECGDWAWWPTSGGKRIIIDHFSDKEFER